MTARAIDADVVRNKLDAIAGSLSALASIGDVDADRLTGDPLIGAAAVPEALRAYTEYQKQIAGFIVSRTPESR